MSVLLALCVAAWGHGLPPDTLSLRVDGAAARLDFTPPERTLSAFDQDADGRLDAAEIDGQRDAIVAAVRDAVVVVDQHGRPARWVFTDVLLGHGHAGDVPAPKVVGRLAFSGVPRGVRVHTELVSDDRPVRALVRVGEDRGEAWLTPQAPEAFVGSEGDRRLPLMALSFSGFLLWGLWSVGRSCRSSTRRHESALAFSGLTTREPG